MSVESARAHLNAMSSPYGYCFPLAVDSLLKNRTLPDDYYDAFKTAIDDPTGGQNAPTEKLLRDFFEVHPQPDTDMASLAEYNAFGASVQTYFPDVDYDYTEEIKAVWPNTEVTSKQMRLQALLSQATMLDCLVIYTEAAGRSADHALALDMIDKGSANELPRYIVREDSVIASSTIYRLPEVTGISQAIEGFSDDFMPLPEMARPYYPNNSTSWELVILPPEPR